MGKLLFCPLEKASWYFEGQDNWAKVNKHHQTNTVRFKNKHSNIMFANGIISTPKSLSETESIKTLPTECGIKKDKNNCECAADKAPWNPHISDKMIILNNIWFTL